MAEVALQPKEAFNPAQSSRIFRIMASDYTEVTLLPAVLRMLHAQAPGIKLDIMTPSDVSFHAVEQGKVDLIINRFDSLPLSFHQLKLWEDSFSCLVKATNPVLNNWNMEGYLSCKHVWVSKTGMGVGVGMTTKNTQRLGWVDEALRVLGQFRDIAIFTRHYQAALMFAEQEHLIVTVPTMATKAVRHNKEVVIKRPPFEIPPMRLKMVWSPLLQNDTGHNWMRQSIRKIAAGLSH
jgi:DNA-binding transcriptional LysR family regulator